MSAPFLEMCELLKGMRINLTSFNLHIKEKEKFYLETNQVINHDVNKYRSIWHDFVNNVLMAH
jgi:hypothetical protein